VNVTVDPLEQGARSRVTIAVDFEGHGIGKLLVPLVVRREAQKGDADEPETAQATP
jgi:hypothetical protein